MFSSIMPSQPSSFSLKPPPVQRARASSSSVRLPLSIATLEPRGIPPALPAVVGDASLSSTTVDSRAQDPTPAFASQQPSGISYPATLGSHSSSTSPSIVPTASTSNTSSMFPVLVRRTVDLWFVLRHGGSGKHAVLLDTPDCSPRSSTDTEYILPLSSSPQKAAFAPEDFASASQLRTQSRLVSFSSVRLFVFFYFSCADINHSSFPSGSRASFAGHHNVSAFNSGDFVMLVNPSNNVRVAFHAFRSRPPWKRFEYICAVRSAPDFTYPWCSLRLCGMEARLVYSGKRVMGECQQN